MVETAARLHLDQYEMMAARLGARVVRASISEVLTALEGLVNGSSVGVTGDLLARFPTLSTLCKGHEAYPQVVISRALWAIASTGNVLLAEREHADRLLTLLTVRHIVLLPAACILRSLRDAAPHILNSSRDTCGGYVTFVGGPSRTADIEKILTVGAHGPRELVVVVVEGWPV